MEQRVSPNERVKVPQQNRRGLRGAGESRLPSPALETTLELGDPNWIGGDLEGDLPGSCSSGEGPGAFGGELDCVLDRGDGGK